MKYVSLTTFIYLIGLNSALGQVPSNFTNPADSDFSVLSFVPRAFTNITLGFQTRAHKKNIHFSDAHTEAHFHFTCSDYHNFGAANPVVPGADLTVFLTYKDSTNSPTPFLFRTKSEVVEATNENFEDIGARVEGMGVPDTVTGTTIVTPSSGYRSGNDVRILLPNSRRIALETGANTGDFFGNQMDSDQKTTQIYGVRISQSNIVPSGTYRGLNGVVDATVKTATSIDGKQMEVTVALPGNAAYCKSQYTPLMLFFDDKLPSFKRIVSFPVHGEKELGGYGYYWPEHGSPGYFLALDKNSNQKIDSGEELFGDTGNFPTGFQNLAQYDENHDDVIDEKDPIFKKLKLWQASDWSPTSKSFKLYPLSKFKITKISLKADQFLKYADERAKIYGRSPFYYSDSKGNEKSGVVHDIYLTKKMIHPNTNQNKKGKGL